MFYWAVPFYDGWASKVLLERIIKRKYNQYDWREIVELLSEDAPGDWIQFKDAVKTLDRIRSL